MKDPESMNISAVFIDGSHWLEDVRIDYDLTMRLIGTKKGLVIFDDTHLHDVRVAIDEALAKYPSLKEIEGPVYLGKGSYYSVN